MPWPGAPYTLPGGHCLNILRKIVRNSNNKYSSSIVAPMQEHLINENAHQTVGRKWAHYSTEFLQNVLFRFRSVFIAGSSIMIPTNKRESHVTAATRSQGTN